MRKIKAIEALHTCDRDYCRHKGKVLHWSANSLNWDELPKHILDGIKRNKTYSNIKVTYEKKRRE